MAHTNKFTGEKLDTMQGVCSGCYRNFSSDTAFDRHRRGPYSARECLDPAEIGLVRRENRYGSPVWGLPGSAYTANLAGNRTNPA